MHDGVASLTRIAAGPGGPSWVFTIEETPAGETYLSVPDQGGMADSMPKDQDQVDWLVARLAGVDGVARVWETSWRLKNKTAMEAVTSMLLLEHGRVTFSWRD